MPTLNQCLIAEATEYELLNVDVIAGGLSVSICGFITTSLFSHSVSSGGTSR